MGRVECVAKYRRLNRGAGVEIAQWWLTLAKEGGPYVAPFLLAAIVWLNIDRNRLIAENKQKDERLVHLSEQSIALAAELRMFLFNERKGA